MAQNVIAKVDAGAKQVLDGVNTVQDVMDRLNATTGYAASLNGDAATPEELLEDGDVVTLAKAVKGGSI